MTSDCMGGQPVASRTEKKKPKELFGNRPLHAKFQARFSNSEPEFSISFPGRGTLIPNFGLQKIYNENHYAHLITSQYECVVNRLWTAPWLRVFVPEVKVSVFLFQRPDVLWEGSAVLVLPHALWMLVSVVPFLDCKRDKARILFPVGICFRSCSVYHRCHLTLVVQEAVVFCWVIARICNSNRSPNWQPLRHAWYPCVFNPYGAAIIW